MFNIEITPLVKTEIRPVPEAQLLDQLYRIFLDKGVHFRVEQVNDESIVFYWTHSNDYLCDTIAAEIGELLNPVAENAKVKATEAEQPNAEVEKQQWPINNGNKPYSLWYDGRKGKEIKETLGALYPDFLNFYWDGNKIIVQMKKFDLKTIEEIRSIAVLIDNDAVRLISVRDIGKEDADAVMRSAVHEYKEKIRGSNYVDGTLTVLVDNDPDVIKWFEEPYSFTYTGPEAEAINDTLTAFYPTKVETKLEGEKLTIKWKCWDAALDEEISNLINEIVDNRLRLLTITTIGKEDADTFMRDIARWFPEKVRQWTYTDNTLTILLNYEPGIIGKLKTHLRDLAGARFLKNNEHSIDAIFREISSGIGCDCPACQKFR